MISNRPMIPMLTHVDNLGDLNLDMTSQEESLQQIEANTEAMKNNLENQQEKILNISNNSNDTVYNTNEILKCQRLINSNVNQMYPTTTNISSSLGQTTDADTATTVIGLLKSIVNKLS